MMRKTVTSESMHKSYTVCTHPSGLKIFLYPMPGFSSYYAMFGTRYGSIDTAFTGSDGKRVVLPEGIAHFLEHKLFESEDGDAFTKYAATGAYANAYTSFDRTCYLFSCSNRFYDNLKILLDFVRSPYFTADTVKKEQGIIGQEIRMYEDLPSWRVMLNMLCGMFENHPVKIDIPGTVESVAQITDRLLYSCYERFYNLSNMFIVLAGDFDVQEVTDFIETNLKDGENVSPNSALPEEPDAVCENYVTQSLDVAKPLFCIGFKEPEVTRPRKAEETVAMEILLKMLLGSASPLYKQLLDEGLVNEEFGLEYFTGRGFAIPLLEGESDRPQKVLELFLQEVDRVKRDGLDPVRFEAIRRELYGRSLRRFDGAESVCSMLSDATVLGYELFEHFEVLQAITPETVLKRLSVFTKARAVLSVVEPKQCE